MSIEIPNAAVVAIHDSRDDLPWDECRDILEAALPHLREAILADLLTSRRWWVATERLAHGGSKIAGPFTTEDDASAAREAIERNGVRTYWIVEEGTGL